MTIKRVTSVVSALVLSVSALSILAVPTALAAANNCTWTGATSNNFNNSSNWSNCNSTVPQTGDNLIFDNSSLSSAATINNDMTGLEVGSITFTGTGAQADSFTIDGNAITVDTAINNNTTTAYESATISAPITLGSNVTLGTTDASTTQELAFGTFGSSNATFNLGSNALTIGNNIEVYMADALQGSGTLTVAGNADTYLNLVNGYGNSADTSGFTGAVAVSAGTLSAGTSDATLSGVSGVVVSGTGALSLDGGTTYDFPLTMSGSNTYGTLEGYCGSDSSCTLTLAGPVTLTGDVTYSGVADTTITGTYTSNGHSITLAGTAMGTITTPDGAASKAAATSETIASTDSQPSTDETVTNNETLTLDGTRHDLTVYGMLEGSGTATDMIDIMPGATLAPGDNNKPGCMTTSNFYLSGTYQVQLGGTTACSGYTQVTASGAVQLGADTSALSVTLYNGFVPKVGQSYTIINNSGPSAVSDTFHGIAEGGTYTNQGVTYAVTYKGGDGNDVVLTVQSIDASQLPKAPDTGMRLVMAHPLVSLLLTTLAAAGIAVVARRVNFSKQR